MLLRLVPSWLQSVVVEEEETVEDEAMEETEFSEELEEIVDMAVSLADSEIAVVVVVAGLRKGPPHRGVCLGEQEEANRESTGGVPLSRGRSCTCCSCCRTRDNNGSSPGAAKRDFAAMEGAESVWIMIGSFFCQRCFRFVRCVVCVLSVCCLCLRRK